MKKKRTHWSEATPALVSGSTSTARPGYVIPRNWFACITDFDLWLVCDGRVELENEKGETAILIRGSVVLLKPGDIYELRVTPSRPYTNAYIHFNMVDPSGETIPHSQLEMPSSLGYVQDIHSFEATMQRVMFLQYQLRQADAPLKRSINRLISHLLKGLLYDYQLAQEFSDSAGVIGLEKHHSQMVSSALSWIYLHPGSTLSAEDLAAKFGCSRRHFGRIFRQVSGKTPGQALIEARIDHAKKLLAGSSLNISEIAASLNYESVFYFSRQFHRIVGISPREFRKAL